MFRVQWNKTLKTYFERETEREKEREGKSLDELKQVNMKPAGQPEQAGCSDIIAESYVLRMLVRRFL